jgi:hypothetical protein
MLQKNERRHRQGMKLFFAVPGEAIRPLMQRAWKGSLGFHQQGLLMTPNKTDRGYSGRQGQDEQPDTDRARDSMH